MTPNSSAGSGPPRPLSVPSDMCKPMTPGWGMRKARQRRPQHTHVACFYSLCLSGRWWRLLHRSSSPLSTVSQLWFFLKISQVLIKPSLFDQFYSTHLRSVYSFRRPQWLIKLFGFRTVPFANCHHTSFTYSTYKCVLLYHVKSSTNRLCALYRLPSILLRKVFQHNTSVYMY